MGGGEIEGDGLTRMITLLSGKGVVVVGSIIGLVCVLVWVPLEADSETRI